MKICIIAPVVIPVLGKKQKYGGIELVISLATEELVKRGHEVILFASGDSKTSAKLISVIPKALGQRSSFERQKTAGKKAIKFAVKEKPDIIWDHTLGVYAQKRIRRNKKIFVLAKKELPKTKIPIIQTIHGPAKDHLPEITKGLAEKGHFFVSISKDQGRRFNDYIGSRHLGTVYNAIDHSLYKPKEKKENFLFWVGRYSMEKGPHIALEVARELKMPIKLMGKKPEKHEQKYFNNFIKPRLGPKDQLLRPASTEKKAEIFRRAKATLMTNIWAEPFGLVAIESMSSGTPVIGPRYGSLPEILNTLGILVPIKTLNIKESDQEITKEQTEYIKRIVENFHKVKLLDPLKIRERAEKKFSVKRNVDQYEKIFRKAIDLKEKSDLF